MSPDRQRTQAATVINSPMHSIAMTPSFILWVELLVVGVVMAHGFVQGPAVAIYNRYLHQYFQMTNLPLSEVNHVPSVNRATR